MKSTVEHLNPTRVKLTVEVPFDELEATLRQGLRRAGRQVRIPGFRPGKVPARILDARLGRGTILSEVVNDAVPAKYGEAVAEAQPGRAGPAGDRGHQDRGRRHRSSSPPRSTSVRRSRCRPSTRSRSTVDDVEVTDADIDEQVEALRDRFATITPVERAGRRRRPRSPSTCAPRSTARISPDATTDGLTYRIGSRRPGRRHRRRRDRPVGGGDRDLHHLAGGGRARRRRRPRSRSR